MQATAPGDIAVIDHVDIDRIAAESLVACKVAAVVDTAASISGRYPNLGPEILLDAGIVLLDTVGPGVFDGIGDGELIRVDGHRTLAGERLVGTGRRLTPESVTMLMEQARTNLGAEMDQFLDNTVEYLRKEKDFFINEVRIPDVRTSFEGRHALIVVRGYHYREDLATLRPYIREYRPVLIGVDGGADALLADGYQPRHDRR